MLVSNLSLLLPTITLEIMMDTILAHLSNFGPRKLANPMLLMIWCLQTMSSTNQVSLLAFFLTLFPILGEHPDHVVVIKYVPAVGDSKRALDEYYSEIFMGGRSTISIYNVCEDSLLASPLIIDLAILCELFTRISYKTDETNGDFVSFHPVLSVLSYMLKAPLVPTGTPVVNALSKQRAAIENILRACVGMPPNSEMTLEHRCF